jgi:hypothetical protein
MSAATSGRFKVFDALAKFAGEGLSAVESKCTACGRIKVYHPERARFNFSGFDFQVLFFVLFRLTFWRAWEDRALRERNSSAQASVDCENASAPDPGFPGSGFCFCG